MKNINNKVSTPSKGAGATSSSSVFDKILAMPTGGQSNGGTYSLDTKLALGVDVEEKAVFLRGQPKKLIKMIAYLCKKNNVSSVSINDLQEFGTTQEAIDLNLSWRIGEVKQAGNVDYTQDIPTICQAYSELFGNKVSKPRTKAGVCNALKIAN